VTVEESEILRADPTMASGSVFLPGSSSHVIYADHVPL
jgi:hypothetical protein